MLVYGITESEAQSALDAINEEYLGNIAFADGIIRRSKNCIRLRLRVNDSRAYGARVSRHGNRTVAVSWEAYRDFMLELFKINPDARMFTMLADYRGRVDFLEKFPATGHTNWGSEYQPVTMKELSVEKDGSKPAGMWQWS